MSGIHSKPITCPSLLSTSATRVESADAIVDMLLQPHWRFLLSQQE